MQLGGKLSTWWTNLDPPGTESQKPLTDSRTLEAAPQAPQEVNLQSTFGLGAEENLIEGEHTGNTANKKKATEIVEVINYCNLIGQRKKQR